MPTLSLSNVSQPAPSLFRKVDNAVSILTNATIVILLALGYKDNSLALLIVKVGISALMNALNALLGGEPTASDGSGVTTTTSITVPNSLTTEVKK